MRKGLGVTLLTVAIAMMGFNAMSMAPMISDVPNVVVGDKIGASSANVFVFPDAITLFATDDNTSATGIIWTFTVADPANPRYDLNGYGPVDLANPSDDPNNPANAKRIDQATMGNSEDALDADPHTVTIRDIKLSPFPKQTSYADPAGGPGIVGSEVITLIASDGTTYSQKDFICYSDDEGTNRYSGVAIEKIVDFASTQAGFESLGSSYWGGNGATITWQEGTAGLCLQTPGGPAGAAYMASWASPYGWFDLTQNAVYKIRMNVTGTSTQVNTTPLWTMFVENFGQIGSGNTVQYLGKNAYSLQIYELDNEGGANAAAATYGRSTFFAYFTPSAVQTAQWNDATNGAFTAQYDADNDPRVQFRVLDANENIVAANRLGTLCLAGMEVDRYDISKVVRGSVVYDQTTFSASDGYVHNYASTVTYPGGKALITPPAGATGWTVEVATLSPGEVLGYSLDPAHVATTWPVPWTSDKLWMYEASIVAPTATDAANPPDILALRIDTPTYETFGDNQMQALTFLGQQGMPTTTASTYTMFFYTQTLTASAIANYDAFRPMVEVTCHTALTQQTSGAFRTTNTGAVQVNEMKITEVTF